MHESEDGVAVLHGGYDEPDGKEIVDLLNAFLLFFHFLMDAVQVFRPAFDLRFNARFNGLVVHFLDDALDVFLALAPFLGDLFDQIVIGFVIQIPEAQIFQFPFDAVHAEAVRKRRVDLLRFAGGLHLFLLRLELEGPHVVEPVRQLDDDDADVLRHGQQHLAEILRLFLLLGGIRNFCQFGDAIHQVGDFLAEGFLELGVLVEGVLNGVVKDAGRNGCRIHVHFRQNAGDRDRVDDVRISGNTGLPFMGGL